MFHFFRKSKFAVVIAIVSLTFSSNAFAEEAQGNRFTNFFRSLFHIPVKATQETAEVAGQTLSNTGEKVVSATGENTAAILQGDLSKTGELVADPIVGTAETAGQSAVETIQIPSEVANSNPDGTTTAEPASV